MKTYPCTACGQFLPAKAFSKNSLNQARDGLSYMCRVCRKAYRDKLAERKPELPIRKQVEILPPEPETPSGSYEYTNGSTLIIEDLGYDAVAFRISEPGEDPDELKAVLMCRDEFLRCLERLQKTICFVGRG